MNSELFNAQSSMFNTLVESLNIPGGAHDAKSFWLIDRVHDPSKRGKFSAVYVPQQIKHNNKDDNKSKATASPFPSGITGD
jgi:hypothetical protein